MATGSQLEEHLLNTSRNRSDATAWRLTGNKPRSTSPPTAEATPLPGVAATAAWPGEAGGVPRTSVGGCRPAPASHGVHACATEPAAANRTAPPAAPPPERGTAPPNGAVAADGAAGACSLPPLLVPLLLPAAGAAKVEVPASACVHQRADCPPPFKHPLMSGCAPMSMMLPDRLLLDSKSEHLSLSDLRSLQRGGGSGHLMFRDLRGLQTGGAPAAPAPPCGTLTSTTTSSSGIAAASSGIW